jgi:pyrroline-5-carboxylate reductase
MLKDKTIGFIGGGNMAEALIKGLLAGGTPASGLIVAEPHAERRTFLAEHYSVSCVEDNSAVVTGCDIIILAIKPQVADKVL